MSVTALRPLADPQAPSWGYADLAACFELSIDTLRRRMGQWENQGFPAPMPWHRHKKRWHPASVLAWKRRSETAIAARAVEFTVHQGGRR